MKQTDASCAWGYHPARLACTEIDAIIFYPALATAPGQVTATEACGFDGFRSAGTGRNPFLPLTLAAEHSTNIEFGTAIAVAFARNPMSMAYLSHDLQA